MTAVEGNAPVYQVYPVSRMTGEGRAEFSRAWVSGIQKKTAGGGNGPGNSICARKQYILYGDIFFGGCGKDAPVYHVYPV